MSKFNYINEAEDYDRSRYVGRSNEYKELTFMNCVKSLLPSDKSIEILDVGCGTGRGVIFLLHCGYNNITGFDYTQEMLDICEKKLNQMADVNIKTIKLIQGDASRLPYDDDSLDLVISLNFLHLFEKKQQKVFIDEMVRVLKPKGSLICEFNNYYRGIFGGMKMNKINPTLTLNKLSDLENLFSNKQIHIKIVRGTSLPYIWRIFQYFPVIGSYIDKIGYYFPLSMIAPKFVVKAEKINQYV